MAVSGRHGAGKSTLAKAIAEHFNLKYVSAGRIFREMAKRRGMNLVEFTKYTETHPKIDRRIDERMKKEAEEGEKVLDSQLAYFFSKEFNPINILVLAKKEDIVQRVSEREPLPLKKAREEVETREENEKKRFKKLYGVKLWDPKDFDIMINTSRVTEDEAKGLAIQACEILRNSH